MWFTLNMPPIINFRVFGETMRKGSLFLLVCFLFGCQALTAQVVSSATGSTSHLWVGAEYSNFVPDWGIPRLPGAGIYADYSLTRRYGIEGVARFFTFTKPGGLTEKSYLGGPYATVYTRNKFSANVRFTIGAGLVNYTGGLGYGSYLEYAPGANVEYRIARRLKARFDYEYDLMPSAPGLPGIPDNGLTPHGFSGGVSYRIF